MPRSRGSFRGQSQRRRTSWELGPGNCTPQVFTSAGPAIIGAGIGLTLDGITLARIRGRFSFVITAASAAGDGFCGAFGIGLCKAPAFAVGVTAVPTPITEQASDDWLFWMPLQVFAGDKTAGDVNWESAHQEFEVDTKAMRKLTIEDIVYAVVEVETEEGTATGEARFDSRSLVMLP